MGSQSQTERRASAVSTRESSQAPGHIASLGTSGAETAASNICIDPAYTSALNMVTGAKSLLDRMLMKENFSNVAHGTVHRASDYLVCRVQGDGTCLHRAVAGGFRKSLEETKAEECKGKLHDTIAKSVGFSDFSALLEAIKEDKLKDKRDRKTVTLSELFRLTFEEAGSSTQNREVMPPVGTEAKLEWVGMVINDFLLNRGGLDPDMLLLHSYAAALDTNIVVLTHEADHLRVGKKPVPADGEYGGFALGLFPTGEDSLATAPITTLLWSPGRAKGRRDGHFDVLFKRSQIHELQNLELLPLPASDNASGQTGGGKHSGITSDREDAAGGPERSGAEGSSSDSDGKGATGGGSKSGSKSNGGDDDIGGSGGKTWTEGEVDEGKVLREFGRGKWKNKMNWPESGQPTNVWDGVVTCGNGQVSNLMQLNLSGKRLTGPIPSALGYLVKLTQLDLSGNALTGSIPPTLRQLQSLQRLDLSHNQLAGPIPNALGYLVKLTQLDLSVNELTGGAPNELGNLTCLIWVDLKGNDLTEQRAFNCALYVGRELGSQAFSTALRVYFGFKGGFQTLLDKLHDEPESAIPIIFLIMVDYCVLDVGAFKFDAAADDRVQEQQRNLHKQRLALEAFAELVLWLVPSDTREDIKFAIERFSTVPSDTREDIKSAIGRFSTEGEAASNLSKFVDFVRFGLDKIDATLELLSDDASFGVWTIFCLEKHKLNKETYNQQRQQRKQRMQESSRRPGQQTWMRRSFTSCSALPLIPFALRLELLMLVLTPLLILAVQVVVPILLAIDQVRLRKELYYGGPLENWWFCPNSAEPASPGFEAGSRHLQKALATSVAMLYFARFFMFSARKLHTGDRRNLSKVLMREIIDESSVARCFAVDDFMDVVYEGCIYLLNLRIVLASEDILSMLLNSLALEFVMQLDDEFKGAYIKVHGEDVLLRMKQGGWIGPTLPRVHMNAPGNSGGSEEGVNKSPRNDRVQSPRNDQVQSPRNDRVQSPRNDRVQSPRDDRMQGLVDHNVWKYGTEQWLAAKTGGSDRLLDESGTHRDSHKEDTPVSRWSRAWDKKTPRQSCSRVWYAIFIWGLELYFLLVAVWSPLCHVTSA
ncbi:unnamed protein product [Phaeothamnion confervicola]